MATHPDIQTPRRMTLRIDQPPVDTRWIIERSWIIDYPATINTDDLTELRSKVQALADEDNFGTLSYRYECDERDRVNVVHAYFIDRKGLNKRFMRLRRD